VKVKSATVVPDKHDNSAGHVAREDMFCGLDPENNMSDRTRLQIERNIIISLAGPAAQWRHNRNPNQAEAPPARKKSGPRGEDDQRQRARFRRDVDGAE
jgi:hypothetical protein